MVFVALEKLYAAALTLVAPPYLYFTVNAIILVIALSSVLHSAPEKSSEEPAAAELVTFLELSAEQQNAPEKSPEEPAVAELVKFLELSAEQQTAPKEDLQTKKASVSARFSPRKTRKQSSEGKKKLPRCFFFLTENILSVFNPCREDSRSREAEKERQPREHVEGNY